MNSSRHQSKKMQWANVLTSSALCIVLAWGGAARAEYNEVRIFADLDGNAATGCTVTLAQGVVTGVEQVLITTVNTLDDTTANVVSVESRLCSGGVLQPRVAVNGLPQVTPWPVGVGAGAGGSSLVETFLPMGAPTSTFARFVVASAPGASTPDSASSDVASASGLTPFTVSLPFVPPVPTLAQLLLAATALLIALAAAQASRHMRAPLLTIVLLTTLTGVAWAVNAVLDGQPSEWAAADLRVIDAAGDNVGGPDLRAVYAAFDATHGGVAFRIDTTLIVNHPPILTEVTVSPKSAPAGSRFTINYAGSDPDIGQTLALELIEFIPPSSGLTCNAMTIGYDTVTRSFVTEPSAICDYEPGTYSLRVRLRDSGNPSLYSAPMSATFVVTNG